MHLADLSYHPPCCTSYGVTFVICSDYSCIDSILVYALSISFNPHCPFPLQGPDLYYDLVGKFKRILMR